jgi:PAS domain S-box-containing protein
MDPIITVDEAQRVVLFNPAAEVVFGWPRAAIVGEPLDKLLPQRFRDRHRAHFDRFAQTATTVGEWAPTRPEGPSSEWRRIPIEASISRHVEDGRVLCTVILRDVSERVRGEQLLVRSEERLSGILDSAMDAIILVDESQQVVIFNPAAEAMFGYPREDALGAPLERFIPERFRDAQAGISGIRRNQVETRRLGGQRLVTGVRRNGEEFRSKRRSRSSKVPTTSTSPSCCATCPNACASRRSCGNRRKSSAISRRRRTKRGNRSRAASHASFTTSSHKR